MISTTRFSAVQLLRSKAGWGRLNAGTRAATGFCCAVALLVVFLAQTASLLEKSAGPSPASPAADCRRDTVSCQGSSVGAAHETAHAMQGFGYVEFDWDARRGGIPGFGPMRESDARVLADATK